MTSQRAGVSPPNVIVHLMTCVACRQESSDPVCSACRATLAPAPDRLVGSLLVRSAFVHDRAARRLVHRLKYGAVAGVARRLTRAMAPLLPADATSLVPLPRVSLRRRRYGVDPALELARALGSLAGLPVAAALRSRPWHAPRAGPAVRQRRGTPVFVLTSPIPAGAVLIDDVVTTGATIAAAGAVTGVARAVTATAAVHPAGT